MKKNVASQLVSAQMIAKATGDDQTTGTCNVAVEIDGTPGTGGTATHIANGKWEYAPIQADTNGDYLTFQFVISGAITATIQVFTHFPQTVDNNVLAAGATGFAAIDTVVDGIATEIGTAGDGLTEAGGDGDHLTAIDLPNQTMDITGNLSGSVGSVTGAVGSVTGAVGSVTGAVGSVAGNVDGSTASVTGAVGSVTGAVGSVTGSVGSVAGNVDGSTASVVGAVGSVAGNVDGSVASVTAEVTADITKISGSATAADNLELSAETIIPFTVTGTPTSTEVAASGLTAITGGDDMLIGSIIIFTSGNARYEKARITDYVDATGTMTVTTLAITPAATDTGIII